MVRMSESNGRRWKVSGRPMEGHGRFKQSVTFMVPLWLHGPERWCAAEGNATPHPCGGGRRRGQAVEAGGGGRR